LLTKCTSTNARVKSGLLIEKCSWEFSILKKRYAKGEIAKEEYERMKKDIEG
jgi:uncharacterized membrane protein